MKEGQTIGQWLKWDFKTNGNLVIKDKNGNKIYWESGSGAWTKREWDSQGRELYYEDSNGYMEKREWDCQGIVIYYKDSNGQIVDNRIPVIIEHNGRKYKLIP